MTFSPAADRYQRMPYNRCGRSGVRLPAVSLGLWHNFGHERPLETPASDPAPRGRPRCHAFRPGEQLRPALRVGGGGLRQAAAGRPPPIPRRARSLDQGRVRHVARAVRRVGLPEVHAREPRPEPSPDGARLRRHLLLPPVRSRDAARGNDGCARLSGAPGEDAVRGHLVLLSREDTGGGGDPRRPGHPTPDPSAVVLDAEPLDRGRAARHTRRARRGVHRVLAARAGGAHRQVPERHPGGLACGRELNALAQASERRVGK